MKRSFLVITIIIFYLINALNGQEITSIDYIMGKFDPSTHPDFIEIPIAYADQQGRLMRKDALESFTKMADEAKKSGINLIIKSSTRNFTYQKGIWEKKWNGTTTLEDNSKATTIADPKSRALKILLYSSMPGTSRHHWGTDIDINNFTNAWFTKGEGKKLYTWMEKNAHKYGFCQVYSAKGKLRSTGYNEEKWHWSYMPISNQILEAAKDVFSNAMISNFLGFETAKSIDMKINYMFGINKDCKK
jgi:zinc D-Ala-D-Ala carboxypeptidase